MCCGTRIRSRRTTVFIWKWTVRRSGERGPWSSRSSPGTRIGKRFSWREYGINGVGSGLKHHTTRPGPSCGVLVCQGVEGRKVEDDDGSITGSTQRLPRVQHEPRSAPASCGVIPVRPPSRPLVYKHITIVRCLIQQCRSDYPQSPPVSTPSLHFFSAPKNS